MYGKFCISYFVNYSYFEHKACVHVRARVHHVFEANYSFCNVCKRLLRDVYSSDPSLSFFLYSTLNHLFRPLQLESAACAPEDLYERKQGQSVE